MTHRNLSLGLFALALSLSIGCKDEEPAEGAAPQAEEGSPVEGASAKASPSKSKASVTRIPAPVLSEAVLGVVGIRSMSDTVSMVRSVGSHVAPGALPPDAVSMVLEYLKRDLGFSDISWVAQDKPVRFVLASDPKFQADNDVLILPISEQSRLEAALKPGSRDNAGDHLAAYEHALAKRFLDVTRGHLVVTRHPEVFAGIKAWLEGGLLDWTPSKTLSIHLDMKRLNARYRQEIQGVKAMLQGALQNQPAGQKPDPQVAHLLAMVEGASRLDVALGESDGVLNLQVGGEAVEGSLPAALIDAMGGRTCGLAGLGRPTSWLGFCSNLDLRKVEAFEEMSRLQRRNLMNALKLPPEVAESLTPILDQLDALTTGDSLVSAYTDGNFPLAVDMLGGVTDAAACHKAHMGVIDLLIPHLWTAFSESMKEQGKALPPARISNLDELVQMAAPFAAAYGLKVKVSHGTRDGATVEALVVEVDWKLLKEQAVRESGDGQKLELLRQLVGDKLSLAAAYKGQRAAVSFGPNGQDNAVDLVNGTEHQGSNKSLHDLGRTSSIAVVLSLGELLDSLRTNPAIAANIPPSTTLSPGEVLSFRSASDGTYISAELSLPLDLVTTVMAITSGP